MKGSLTKKLVMAYSVVLGVFLIITVLLLNITARRSLENNIIKNLHTESAIIEELYRNQVKASLDKNARGDQMEEIKTRIKTWFSDIKKLADIGFASDIALVIRTDDARLGVFTPGETQNEVNFKLIKPEDLEKQLQGNPVFFRITGGKTPYFAVSRPLSETGIPSAILKAWIITYLPVRELNHLVQDMNIRGAYAIGIALLVSAFLSWYLSLNISKPIKFLNKQAERIASRDFKARVHITTGDEIESLGHAMNKIAGDLSDYDLSQKRFLQNVSHELKTPVMAIMGYAEGLRDGVIDDRDKALNVIVDECGRLQRLHSEVLYLSKLETVEEFYSFKSEKLNEVLKAVRDKVQGLADTAGISLELMLEDDCRVQMDRDKLIQAVLNLITNAVRYARTTIVLRSRLSDAKAVIEVWDDGPGMNEAELNNVFERFYKGRKGHTGLGMTITKAIVEKHGGTITAANRPEGGALFTLIFPSVS